MTLGLSKSTMDDLIVVLYISSFASLCKLFFAVFILMRDEDNFRTQPLCMSDPPY